MPYDLEIVSDSLKLIVEIQGKQHYQSSGFHAQTAKKNNSSPEKELAYQKKKDEIKKKFALLTGYNYLVIPYTSDNKAEDYKTLINEAISKIKRRLSK